MLQIITSRFRSENEEKQMCRMKTKNPFCKFFRVTMRIIKIFVFVKLL